MIDSVTGIAGAAVQPQLRLVTSTAQTGAQDGSSANDQGPPAPGGPVSDAAVAGAAQATAAPPPATRVYVDHAPCGVYVYRLVDVATGRTLVELPRAQSDQLKLSEHYAPGSVADASA